MLPFPADHRVPRPRHAAASQPAAAARRLPAARGPVTVDASAAAARRATIAQLRRLLAAGYSRFDPLGASAARLQMQHGLSAGWRRMVKGVPLVAPKFGPCSS